MQPVQTPPVWPRRIGKEQLDGAWFERSRDIARHKHADDAFEHPALEILSIERSRLRMRRRIRGKQGAIVVGDGLGKAIGHVVEGTESTVMAITENVRRQAMDRHDLERLRLLPAQAGDLGRVVQLELAQEALGDEMLARNLGRTIGGGCSKAARMAILRRWSRWLQRCWHRSEPRTLWCPERQR